jgi:hypothetical protein
MYFVIITDFKVLVMASDSVGSPKCAVAAAMFVVIKVVALETTLRP